MNPRKDGVVMLMKSVLVSAVPFLICGGVAFAEPSAEPAATPSGTPSATTQPAPDSYEGIQAEARAIQKHYLELVPTNDLLADENAAKRDAVAAQAIPLLKQIDDKLDAMMEVRPDIKRPILAVRLNQEAALVALNDADTLAALNDKIKAGGPKAELATNVLLRGQWMRAGKDAQLQAQVIAALDKAAQGQPKDVFLSQFVADIRPHVTDPAMKQHLMELMVNTMDNPTSKGLVKVMQNSDKTQALQGKPIVLAGKQPDGTDFTTANLNGKVILVDFWAVWCAPCRAELPRVKKVYDEYHDKGLEVVGVDNDYEAETVTKFTARDKLPWPQLFDAESAAKEAWHPLTREFGIDGIPVMFLIDKKGVCRTVTARDDFEKLIPQMLAE